MEWTCFNSLRAKIFEDREAGLEITRMQKFNGVTDNSRLTQIRDRNAFNHSDWKSRINQRDLKIPFQRTHTDSAREKKSKKETDGETKFSTLPYTNIHYTSVNE